MLNKFNKAHEMFLTRKTGVFSISLKNIYGEMRVNLGIDLD
jgi:hypothetical protein